MLCASLWLKFFFRYLDLYERVHFLGEEVDRRESELHDEDDARSRRRALRLLHATPLSYNLQQHYIAGKEYCMFQIAIDIGATNFFRSHEAIQWLVN